jgi:hypothetical protein
MPYNAVIGETSTGGQQVVVMGHPAVIRTGMLRSGQGDVPAGRVLPRDRNNEWANYEPGLVSAASWQGEVAYAVGDLVIVGPEEAEEYYVCVVAGVSGASEPTWPGAGNTVVDGAVTWRGCGSTGGVDTLDDGCAVLAGSVDTSGGAQPGRLIQHGTVSIEALTTGAMGDQIDHGSVQTLADRGIYAI